MWRFKQFMPREHTGLEGRAIDVGNIKVQIRNAIAEGGFSCVYLARDAIHSSKQYALKHIICNDDESIELVMKEISVMKSLRGHPNVVALLAHTILDMGRTKEAFLVMEFCEKSLVNVLESRGGGYFEEKQIFSIFRDVCNAVFAMHCQTPPIAHRDLKAENLLLGPNGMWKLCDFGSTSTNHKRFERPEEMGIEEDNIRKYTTPAYRAPEMWDLFRRELINEKVDIWALGCLLYRICYFKFAFDGESKLQILNGNYRIPDLPKYSSSITGLIEDMLQSSPDARPDITQVWFRVNQQLPVELQKSLPDRPPSMHQPTVANHGEGISNTTNTNRVPAMPRRSPPPPPSSREQVQNVSPLSGLSLSSTASGGGSSLGSFWTTQHAKDSHVSANRSKPTIHVESNIQRTMSHGRQNPDKLHHAENFSPAKVQNIRTCSVRNPRGVSLKRFDDVPSKDFEIRFFSEDTGHEPKTTKVSNSSNVITFQDEAFNTFVAEFDTNKLDLGNSGNKNKKKPGKEEAFEAEVDRLKEQLKQANTEKAEIKSKYEKLSAICRSQQHEIQELRQALAAKTVPNKEASKNQNSFGNCQSSNPPQREKIEGTVRELQQGILASSSPIPDSKPWRAFFDETKPQTPPKSSSPRSVRTTNGHQNKQAPSGRHGPETWNFEPNSFKEFPSSTQVTQYGQVLNFQLVADSKSVERKQASLPAGWAGF
ncbi:PREDICTED: actin-regulating kinase 1-like isoform X2 [Nelumbo nucifera]|uniref:non-specific serine/threonine protein kinase n=1 Tax=Nelumbo nucifera TaxID=4432 RepID=A0A1U8A6F4_NELNU|nr:PREDICTED: actin-regulating kinase 1-like isoform X2 [Nelumbo nucifera]